MHKETQTSTHEINGDERLGVGDRLRYLWRNAGRNLQTSASPPFRRFARWNQPAEESTDVAAPPASPMRALAESFIVHKLPKHLPPGDVDILEIGCGRGGDRALLARAGYSGRYTGVDVKDKFDHTAKIPGILSEFRRMDAHEIEISAQYDLIFSNSALEHIADDTMLVARLRSCLRPGGIQFHMVPSGSSLFAYLWHGYRQYTPGALARRFDPLLTDVFTLGGFASLFVHIIWITLPEKLLRRDLRNCWTTPTPHALAPRPRLIVYLGSEG